MAAVIRRIRRSDPCQPTRQPKTGCDPGRQPPALSLWTPVLKPYLSIAELARLTPWTDQAVRTTISLGVFERGSTFFTWVGVRSSNGPRSSASSNKGRCAIGFPIAAIN